MSNRTQQQGRAGAESPEGDGRSAAAGTVAVGSTLAPYHDFSRAFAVQEQASSRPSSSLKSGGDEDDQAGDDELDSGRGKRGKGGSSNTSAKTRENFPAKLHAILSDDESFEDCVSWLPHGRSFCIVDAKKLEEKALSNFFAHKSFSSFVRQINGWGFVRVTNGSDRGSYYHELFLRGLPNLTQRMRRRRPGGPRKNLKEANKLPPPDFDAISRVRPLPSRVGDPLPPLPKDEETEATATRLELDGECCFVRDGRSLTSSSPLSPPSSTSPKVEGEEQEEDKQLSAEPFAVTDIVQGEEEESRRRRSHVALDNSPRSPPQTLGQALPVQQSLLTMAVSGTALQATAGTGDLAQLISQQRQDQLQLQMQNQQALRAAGLTEIGAAAAAAARTQTVTPVAAPLAALAAFISSMQPVVVATPAMAAATANFATGVNVASPAMGAIQPAVLHSLLGHLAAVTTNPTAAASLGLSAPTPLAAQLSLAGMAQQQPSTTGRANPVLTALLASILGTAQQQPSVAERVNPTHTTLLAAILGVAGAGTGSLGSFAAGTAQPPTTSAATAQEQLRRYLRLYGLGC